MCRLVGSGGGGVWSTAEDRMTGVIGLVPLQSKKPVTLVPEWARMPSEWKFVVYSSVIEVHFKNSDCILCAFQIFGRIIVTGTNVLLMLKTFRVHSKWRNIERHLKCILTALWLLSKYSYSIPHILISFVGESKWQATSNPVRMPYECSSIAARITPEI